MRKTILVLLTIAVLAVPVVPAAAHEEREAGDYTIELGWRIEPAIVGQLNGPEVFITPKEDASSLGDVEILLEVEVTFGPASRTISLQPVSGEPGHFVADMIPTRPGDYTFHLTGSIGDVGLDESFSSADGAFSSVEPASDIQFPEPDPIASELSAQIAALEARIAALEAQLGE